MGAAGAIEAAIACAALESDETWLPWQQGFADLDPVFADLPFVRPDSVFTGRIKRIMSNSFAFAGSNASTGLMLGSFFALIITICFYSIRRVLSFTDCCNSIPEGFKAMVPAILILTFAWTLKTMTESLGAKEFVAGLVGGVSGPLLGLFPAIIFLVGAFLAFATGTSWGTFGILIPIVVNIFSGTNHTMMIISISACMAGAVCGDHCSPISDTTIMASAGAQCNHMNHVSTQLPYVVLVAAISCLTYIIAGFVRNPVVPFIIGVLILIGTFVGIKYIIKYITRTDKANEQAE